MSFVIATPSAAILYAQRVVQLTPTNCVALFCAAAGSAGVATFAAWGLDSLVRSYRVLEDRVDRAEYRP